MYNNLIWKFQMLLQLEESNEYPQDKKLIVSINNISDSFENNFLSELENANFLTLDYFYDAISFVMVHSIKDRV